MCLVFRNFLFLILQKTVEPCSCRRQLILAYQEKAGGDRIDRRQLYQRGSSLRF
jgi:hypothetical protein